MYITTKIRMKSGCYYSNNLLEIDELYLSDGNWYKKERIHDHVKYYPGSIKVGSISGPNVIPAVSGNGEKYVRSSPNNSTKDNLLELPRE